MDPQKMRKPETVQALAALKTELNKAASVGSPKEVIEMLRAACKNVNPNWTVPELDDPDGINKYFTDGTVSVMLLAHKILINPSGAYRIVDLHPPQNIFHECASSTGSAFLDPCATN